MTQPEVNLAKRIIEKNGLSPPIDVRKLVKQHADLQVHSIPFRGIDGICLNLKVPGKRPRVIINAGNAANRMRFTLAHELGHIIIPWHMGSFVDCLDSDAIHGSVEYWAAEDEANRFAAELLMPSSWVENHIKIGADLAIIHKSISERCEVSAHAAAIRLAQFLPANITFAIESSGNTEIGGRTDGTLANPLSWGEPFLHCAYSYANEHFHTKLKTKTLHWWILPDGEDADTGSLRTWKEILDSIVGSLDLSAAEQKQLKSSVAGVIAYANGAVKQTGTHTVSGVMAACIQRFHDRPQYDSVYRHPEFRAFLSAKARLLVEGNVPLRGILPRVKG